MIELFIPTSLRYSLRTVPLIVLSAYVVAWDGVGFFWDAYKGRILWKELRLQGVYAGDA
jgi:hypothetical protein